MCVSVPRKWFAFDTIDVETLIGERSWVHGGNVRSGPRAEIIVFDAGVITRKGPRVRTISPAGISPPNTSSSIVMENCQRDGVFYNAPRVMTEITSNDRSNDSESLPRSPGMVRRVSCTSVYSRRANEYIRGPGKRSSGECTRVHALAISPHGRNDRRVILTARNTQLARLVQFDKSLSTPLRKDRPCSNEFCTTGRRGPTGSCKLARFTSQRHSIITTTESLSLSSILWISRERVYRRR